MADGSVKIAVDADAREAQKALEKLNRQIAGMEANIQKMNAQRFPLAEQAAQLAAQLDAANAKLYEMQNAQAGQYTTQQIETQAETVKSLAAQYNEVQRQVEGYDRRLQKAGADLEYAKDKAGDLTEQVTNAADASVNMEKAAAKVSASFSRVGKRITNLIKRVLFYSIISRGLSQLRSWIGSVITANDDASAAIGRFKGALMTLAQPIMNAAIPALTYLVNVLAQVVAAAAEFVSILFGTTFAASKDAAKKLNDEQKAIAGVGGAAKEAERSLAAFDEINKLTAENAGSGDGASSGIAANFNDLTSSLPDWLAKFAQKLNQFASDLKIKIKNLKFDWDRGNILKSKDAWIVALSAILGAVLGTMFGGLKGGIIGLLLGAALGLTGLTFLDKLKNPEKAKSIAMVALAAILGAVLGSKFGGLTGGIIGLLLGASIGLISARFTDGKLDKWTASDTFNTVITAIMGAVVGAAFGGFTGAIIGLLFGAAISVLSVSFEDELKNAGIAKSDLYAALNLIGFGIAGAMFGGIAGGIMGLVIGITFNLASAAFDDSLSAAERTRAAGKLKAVVTAIIFALIGTAIAPGIGTLVGAVVGLTLGLAIHWGEVTMDDYDPKSIRKGFSSSGNRVTGFGGGGRSAALYTAARSMTLPRLATGAVIPPNREFMAVLGDQKSGNNIEAPEALIRKIVREETGGSARLEALLQTLIEVTREGKVIQVNERELGRVTSRAQANAMRSSGKAVLSY